MTEAAFSIQVTLDPGAKNGSTFAALPDRGIRMWEPRLWEAAASRDELSLCTGRRGKVVTAPAIIRALPSSPFRGCRTLETVHEERVDELEKVKRQLVLDRQHYESVSHVVVQLRPDDSLTAFCSWLSLQNFACLLCFLLEIIKVVFDTGHKAVES